MTLACAAAEEYALTCAVCGRRVALSVAADGAFLDLGSVRGWEYDGAAGKWRCAACVQAARRRREEKR